MTATLEEIENRLVTLEQVVASLRQQIGHGNDEAPAARGARLLSESGRIGRSLASSWASVLGCMGIVGEPLKPEEVQQVIRGSTSLMDGNEFSRCLVEMREE